MKSKEDSLSNQAKKWRINTSARLPKYENKPWTKTEVMERKMFFGFLILWRKETSKTKKLSNYCAKPTSNFKQNFKKML